MSSEGSGQTTATRRGRALRPAWSLAAGTSSTPHVGAASAFVVIVLALTFDTHAYIWLPSPLHDWLVTVHRSGRWLPAVCFVLLCLAIPQLSRTMHRWSSQRRRTRGDRAFWWRDRDWDVRGVERRIAAGMRATWFATALSVAATWMLYALGLSYGRAQLNLYTEPELWGWVPASPASVVIIWILPVAWLALVVGPRLGHGRLVVAWPELPQRTGTRAAFHVATSPGGARIDGARVFLRCIRTQHRPFLPLAAWNARLAWVAEARLPLNAYVGPETHLRAEFDVPAGAPSTDFHAKDAVRWEVLVLGTVAGTDYAQGVDVPVYSA